MFTLFLMISATSHLNLQFAIEEQSMTRNQEVNLNIAPIGGLRGIGASTGKAGILKSRRVSGLILQVTNLESPFDEMRILAEEGVTFHPVRTLIDSKRIVFGGDASVVLRKKERSEIAVMSIQLS